MDNRLSQELGVNISLLSPSFCRFRQTGVGALLRVSCELHDKSLQSWPTLWNSMDCSPPGSSVHVIFQARILERVAMSSSRDLPDADIRPISLKSPELAGKFITTSATCKAPMVSQGLNQSESRAAFYPEDMKLNLFPILLCLLTEFSTTVRCSFHCCIICRSFLISRGHLYSLVSALNTSSSKPKMGGQGLFILHISLASTYVIFLIFFFWLIFLFLRDHIIM